MERSSVQVFAATRRRLARYKERGMSYDDVLAIFMEAIEPDEFRRRWREARAHAARDVVAASTRTMPPSGAADAGARMEAAFRLFTLTRGTP